MQDYQWVRVKMCYCDSDGMNITKKDIDNYWREVGHFVENSMDRNFRGDDCGCYQR